MKQIQWEEDSEIIGNWGKIKKGVIIRLKIILTLRMGNKVCD